jgi:hypothetical protein
MNIPLLFGGRTGALRRLLAGVGVAAVSISGLVRAQTPVNDYPTTARVEYVNECIGSNGGALAALYQCSCAIDRIAAKLTYDEFVEAGTFAKYAALPGEGGGIFRDSGEAKKLAKLYRELESEAHRSCGLAR